MEAFSVQWWEHDKRGRIVEKKQNFETDQLREKFISALTEKDNFHEIKSWTDRKER